MRKLSQIWFKVQDVLFPFVEKKIEEPLINKLKNLVITLELIRMVLLQPGCEGIKVRRSSMFFGNRMASIISSP
jgi:hypothetical protein